MAEILAKCDTLPGGFVILSKYQEQGIFHLENWHQTNQQNMVNELISSGFLDSDYETEDDESSDGTIEFEAGEAINNGDETNDDDDHEGIPSEAQPQHNKMCKLEVIKHEEEETRKKCHILERCTFRAQKRIYPLYELLSKVALTTTMSPISIFVMMQRPKESIHHYSYMISNTFRVSLSLY